MSAVFCFVNVKREKFKIKYKQVAKSKIREKETIVWEILQEVMRGHPILL
jgi:DNA-directed RNA polymerase beta' subunit